MLGLYVHIPFCARRCPYCDFAVHIGASQKFVDEYLATLCQELQQTLRQNSRPLTSIFFGGGTPTALASSQLSQLLQLIKNSANVNESCEISIEANPENLDFAKLQQLQTAGFNRLSLGAQSFDDAVLKTLNRKHCAAQVDEVFAAARQAGFANISLDLIFAVPGQSRQSWRETLHHALEISPEHLSCYALTIEENTAFARRVEKNRLTLFESDAEAGFMQDATEILRGNLERYEVSNYARRGFECRHNLNYWRGGDYLAAGCGAHGHLAGHRWWNERAAARYVQLINEQGSAKIGEEWLTPRQRLDERVLLGLRLREGFDLQEVSLQTGLDARRELNGALHELSSRGMVLDENNIIQLAPENVCVADAIALQLLQN